MKKKLIIAAIVLILLIVGFILFKPKSFSKEFEATMSNLTSYTLKGEMELNKGEEIKHYLLEVHYKKGIDDDLYKVSLFDKNLNQEQILLRNPDGVFVITPSLNQIFKFEGEWPMNSPKPYLIQTMADIIRNEKSEITQTKEGATILTPVSYPNNKNYISQEMFFDNEAKPCTIQIYDEDKTVQLRLVFENVSYNNDISDDVFTAPKELAGNVSLNTINESDLPLYPVSIFDSKLASVNEMQINGEVRHVLEFSGEKNFTIIESIKEAKNETETVFVAGEMIDALDIIGIYDGSSMSTYHQNIEITIFSSDLSQEEMMNVLASLQVAVMK